MNYKYSLLKHCLKLGFPESRCAIIRAQEPVSCTVNGILVERINELLLFANEFAASNYYGISASIELLAVVESSNTITLS